MSIYLLSKQLSNKWDNLQLDDLYKWSFLQSEPQQGDQNRRIILQ